MSKVWARVIKVDDRKVLVNQMMQEVKPSKTSITLRDERTIGNTLYKRALHNESDLVYDTKSTKWKAKAMPRDVVVDFNLDLKQYMNSTPNAFGLDDTNDGTGKVMPEELGKSLGLSADVEQELAELSDLHNSSNKRPDDLIIHPLKWKILYRAAKRGINILMTGPAGSGKTTTVYKLGKVVDQEVFYFNLGATQDPVSVLIGQTHFDKEVGTFFNHSLFVRAIQQENAIILLDELSRAHPEAWNILMSVTDKEQGYLRLDAEKGTPEIKVAPGVTFIATANVGVDYTSTRTIDKAMKDRFTTVIEMNFLTQDQETKLLHKEYPGVPLPDIELLCRCVSGIRAEQNNSDSEITTDCGTRVTKEAASMLQDGFTLAEVFDGLIYPIFSDDGMEGSEREAVKQLCQAFVPASGKNFAF